MADWSAMILQIGEANGFWGSDRHVVVDEARLRPGATDVMALRVGFEKLARRRLGAEGVVGRRDPADDPLVRRESGRWIGRVDWLTPERSAT